MPPRGAPADGGCGLCRQPYDSLFRRHAHPIGTPLILFVLLSVLRYSHFIQPRLSTLMPFLGLSDLRVSAIGRHRPAPIFPVHFVATRPRAQWLWILRCGGRLRAVCSPIRLHHPSTYSPWTWMLPSCLATLPSTHISQFTLMQWFGNAIALNRMLHTLVLMTACGLWVAYVRISDPLFPGPVPQWLDCRLHGRVLAL